MLPFSTDDDFDELSDRDQTTELIGFVDEIIATQEVGQKAKYKLFKFVLNNGSKRCIMCLIWGEELISKYQEEVQIHRIMHIDGGYTKSTQMSFYKEAQNFVPFELVIQKGTVIKFLGFHNYVIEKEADNTPKEVTFDTINQETGLISIEGHIKTKFSQAPSRYENMSYGCGAITDGTFKVTIQVGKYTPIDVKKGVRVKITGEIKDNGGPLTVMCKSSNCITPMSNAPKMSQEQLLGGTKTPKRKSFTK